MFFILFILSIVQLSWTASCCSNPCQLNSIFSPPGYNVIQLIHDSDVICTCPNGQGRRNAPCRICDTVDCGPNGVCIEPIRFHDLYYACACKMGENYYLAAAPCLGSGTTTTISTTTLTTTTTLIALTCLNGGDYDFLTGVCICKTGFTGIQCEISNGQKLCKRITCVNGGVCNPVPTANNGIAVQCWCVNGFSGDNCELIGTSGGCHENSCQNRGVCDERRLGSSRFAYCQCQPGFTGRFCERNYFMCSHTGMFDDTVNCKFGRYFQCVDTLTIARSCPKGLRFNSVTMQCDIHGSCPA